MGIPGSIELFILLSLVFLFIIAPIILKKIDKKFGNERSAYNYFIPIYNIFIVGQNANINPLIYLGLFIPYLNIAIYVYIWSEIAKKLGKNGILYGLGIVFLFFPIFKLLSEDEPIIDKTSHNDTDNKSVKDEEQKKINQYLCK
ncbi:MAG: hypothetical protein U9R37_05880 [Campylobacterota bacterium]|nr:hypothetical protein [Campylobacterota bacterium]